MLPSGIKILIFMYIDFYEIFRFYIMYIIQNEHLFATRMGRDLDHMFGRYSLDSVHLVHNRYFQYGTSFPET